jgi:hypothetical protein
MSGNVKWENLPGNEAGIQYYELEPFHKGYRSFMAGFRDKKITPGDLVRVYASPSQGKEPADNTDGWIRGKELEVLGFRTYRVDDEGNFRHTVDTLALYEAKEKSPEEVLGREKIYQILK